MGAATRKLVSAEERSLRDAMVQQPEGVTLHWDWKTKVFDAFLSHKMTDAKDVARQVHVATHPVLRCLPKP